MSKFKVMLLSAFLVASIGLTASNVYATEEEEDVLPGGGDRITECDWVCTIKGWF